MLQENIYKMLRKVEKYNNIFLSSYGPGLTNIMVYFHVFGCSFQKNVLTISYSLNIMLTSFERL